MTSKGDIIERGIQFYNSMTPYDRVSQGCFLRSKFVSPSDSLVPVSDLERITPPTAYRDSYSADVFTADDQVFIIGTKDGTTNGLITEIDEGTSVATVRVDNAGLGEVDSQCAVYYPTAGYVSIVDRNGGYHTFNPSTGSITLDVDTEGAGDPSIILHKADDIVYWVVDNAIHSDNDGVITNNLVRLPGGIGRNILLEFSTYVVCITYLRDTQEVMAYFWDRDPSNAFFDRNPVVATGRLMGAGVIDGGVMTVAVFEYTPDNRDFLGKINIYQYLGGDTFKLKSWIPVKNSSYVPVDNPFYCDGKYLYLATPRTTATGYIESGYYRVDSQGQITVENIRTDSNRFMGMARAANWTNEMIAVYDGDDDNVYFARQAVLDKTDSDVGGFTARSDYITKLLEDPEHKKKLVYVDVSFEELNTTFDQEVEIHYRTHPDATWTQLKDDIEYNANKDNNNRRLISVGGNGSMPAFRQIQFRIVSFHGAIITKVSYGFRYQSDKATT